MAKQPNVDINFRDAGDTAIDKADRGIVYLILEDASVEATEEVTFFNIAEIPEEYSDYNKEQIKLAMIGSYLAPRRVSAIVGPVQETFTVEGNEALSLLATTDCDYFAVPGATGADATDIATWIQQHNESGPMRKFKAVLPDTVADDEHVINVTQDGATTIYDTVLQAEDLCSLVAGMRAGSPMQFSLDNFTTTALKHVPPVDMRLGQDGDERVQSGEFFFNMNRGKVSVVADVNSLTTLVDKDETYQQNKEVDIMDALYNGLKPSIMDKYIGKVTNSYQGKLLLVSAVEAYLETFEQASLVEPGDSACEIDIDAQRLYLKSIDYTAFDGRKVDELNREETLKANTKGHVFLKVRFLPLSAIRHVTIEVHT